MVAGVRAKKLPEGERDKQIGEPSRYKGWILPSPPSLEVSDDDFTAARERLNDSDFPNLFSWSPSRDQESPSNLSKMKGTAYVEWKKTPNKRRTKKEIDLDDSSCQSTIVTTEDGTIYIRRSRVSAPRSSRYSTKENDAPTYNPRFSKSRYKKQQKFKSLTTYYKEKMKEESRQDDNLEDLVAVKMELSDLKAWVKKDKPKAKRVQFAHPLITATNYRPRTKPEEIDELFFRDDDLQDWEDDRETTSSERFEVTILDNEEKIIASDCISVSSHDL